MGVENTGYSVPKGRSLLDAGVPEHLVKMINLLIFILWTGGPLGDALEGWGAV